MNTNEHNAIIWTQFYQTIIEPSKSYCIDGKESNYTPYQLFVLTTRLNYWIQKHWDKNITIGFPSAVRDNKDYITIQPINVDGNVKPTIDMAARIQKFVNKLTSQPLRGLLLMSGDSIITNNENIKHDQLIPSDWIHSMLPYVKIASKFNPYIEKEGIMVELTNYLDYKNVFDRLIIDIVGQLRTMYSQGYIINPPLDIVKKWKLVATKSNGSLYQPDEITRFIGPLKPIWNNSKITQKYDGPYGFLRSRINGDSFIDLYVGENYFTKHIVSQYLLTSNITGSFSDYYVKFEAEDYSQAQKVVSMIDSYSNKYSGRVIRLYTNRLSWTLLYRGIAENLGYDNTTVYLTDDIKNPYIFSCVIPISDNSDEVIKTISITSDEIVNRIEDEMVLTLNINSDIDGFVTIHDRIENEGDAIWTKFLK